MPRKEHHTTPKIVGHILYTEQAAVPLDTPAVRLPLIVTPWFPHIVATPAQRCKLFLHLIFRM